MSVKPILFNTEMVKAILAGRKTQTRRVVKFKKGQNPKWTGYVPDGDVLYGSNNIPAAKALLRKDDVLWVRETRGIPAIEELLARAEAAEARAEKAEKERDAAVSDLRGCAIESCAECMYCLYRTAKSFCGNCTDGANWKWKGQKEE